MNKILNFLWDADNRSQKLWEKLLFGQLRDSIPFPLLTLLRDKEQKLRLSYVIGWQHCIRREGGFLNTLFKIAIIICH